MLDLFTQFALIIVLASVLGIVARRLGQPTILAYLVAGMVAGVVNFFDLSGNETVFHLFSDLGIMFLLFLVGLEVNYTALRLVGRDSFLIGMGQVLFTFLATLLIAHFFDYGFVSSLYISIALTFSSTIIGVNLLSEKKELNSLHGRLSVGMLLVQDFVAILVLVVLAGVGSGDGILEIGFLGGFIDIFSESLATPISIAFTVLLGGAIIMVAFYASRFIIPKLFESIARSDELIFLGSLAWLFIVTALITKIGFSREIGGFIAGITLANSFENLQIANRIRTLRDFFIMVFFVILGISVVAFSDFSGITGAAIALSLFVLIGNPLIVILLMGFLGYKKQASFLTGVIIAQISEFSLVVVALGERLGHIDKSIVTLITLVAIITFTVSTYMITHSKKIYSFFAPYLSFFEKKHTTKEHLEMKSFTNPIVLVGFHRTGKSIAYNLPREDVLIIEFDPETIKELERNNFDYIFGDMSDNEILSRIDISRVRVFVSTCPDMEDNLLFLKELTRRRKTESHSFKIVMRARTDSDARLLYNNGADYCILPHFSAGRHFAKIIASDPYLQTLPEMKRNDLETITRVLGYVS